LNIPPHPSSGLFTPDSQSVQDMGVDHGCKNVIVAQEFLNGPDVIVRLQQVGIGFHVVYVTTHKPFFWDYTSNHRPVNYYLPRLGLLWGRVLDYDS
jgi:hypothetical protein